MGFNDFALAYEPQIRIAAFVGVFLVVGLWEAVAPRRMRLHPRIVRWTSNLGIVALNTLLLRVLFPTAAVAFAALAAERGWGLLHAYALPDAVEVVLAIVLLDLAIYLQHVMFHAVPALWRLHRVHHADPDYDVTTGARFHPIEIVLSMLIKLAVIALLGAPALAVLAFEVLLNATAMFNHANAGLPARVDRVLRWVLVTPDMHRIHHSMERDETDSNFGFNLPWWDRLFGTYRAGARLPQERMEIGVRGLSQARASVEIHGMLAMPFVDATPRDALGAAPPKPRGAR